MERMLDQFAEQHPDVTIARFRPTVVVQRQASWLIKTLYLGPLVPKAALEMLRRRQLPILPLPAGLGLQFVHADDVGDAVVRMIEHRAQGPTTSLPTFWTPTRWPTSSVPVPLP